MDTTLRSDSAGALPTAARATLDLAKLGDRNGRGSNYETDRSSPAAGSIHNRAQTSSKQSRVPEAGLPAIGKFDTRRAGSVPPGLFVPIRMLLLGIIRCCCNAPIEQMRQEKPRLRMSTLLQGIRSA